MDAGRYREMGLDASQARELAEIYRKALQKEYGREPDTLQEIDRRIREASAVPQPPGSEIVPNSRRSADARQPAAARGSDHDTPGLFDQATERQSQVDAQRGADQLLGDQLTAQFQSGLAAKPTKLKPAQNSGLFEEQGPPIPPRFHASTGCIFPRGA
jgi:hypothetical protein